MAISMGTALLGSAIIGGVGSAIGASSSNKAINRATDAQVQANRDSLAVQQDIYSQNNALLSPYVERGNSAGDAINALLGLQTATASGTGAPSSTADFARYVAANPDLQREWQRLAGSGQFASPADYGRWHYNNYGAAENRSLGSPGTAGTATTPTSATNAFNNYLDSAGYQFQLGEMNDAANAQFRAAGALDSGAAVKAAQERAQSLGTGFFNNYLSLLSNQQGVGLSGASAVAGVGTNYANSVTGINDNTASALGNAALTKANNTNSLLSGLTSSFGLGAGAMSRFG